MTQTENPKRKARIWEAGVALVEFALVLPFLMLVLIGIVELGRYLYFGILVGNAAHAGAQYGSLSLPNANDKTRIENAALNDGQNVSGLTVSSPAPSVVCSCWNGTTSTSISCNAPSPCATASPAAHEVVYVQVTATGTLSPLLRWPGLPSTYTVTRQAVMRVNQQGS